MRDGYRVRWQGQEYEASPDGDLLRLYSDEPQPGFDEIRDGRYRRLVTRQEADWFGYVRTVGIWSGQPVLVLAELPHQVLVEYTGGRAPAALLLGLPRIDLGVYQGWVDRAQVADIHQERVDG